ncbi:hypothetical protein ETB97_011816 [Aspergillus alliaceus]|uniref:Uncharacterized protein n=1 Tax=Petromyces alliaceus TaxID=209559 RepID=A0A5N7CI79_PETAA|nr:hypothetical protein BDV23DRAFT_180320 [Aspergillus alliaceus]KAF5862292.1 hypothetical protein ETB97_011816 [Aspergillus burnettii]
MNIKAVLAFYAIASVATAAPAEDLGKRACAATQNRFCCETFFPVNFLGIRAVGTNCIASKNAPCPRGKKEACCTRNFPLDDGDLACTAL